MVVVFSHSFSHESLLETSLVFENHSKTVFAFLVVL